MKFRRVLGATALAASLVAGPALAADKAAQQAEILKTAQETLQQVYKAQPQLKSQVERAPGYAVFTTYGLTFFIGGAGGKGVVHNNKTKQNTYMHLAQASAGVQAGIADYRTLIIFKTEEALNNFVNKGWEFAGGGGAAAGAGTDTAGATTAESTMDNASYYTITKTGVQAGGASAGTKVWKDKDLN
jgi:lipid-binding SYLF domain-containing protein